MRPSQFGGKQGRRCVAFGDNGWEVRGVVEGRLDFMDLDADARVGAVTKVEILKLPPAPFKV